MLIVTLKIDSKRVDALTFILIELGVVLKDKYGDLQIRSLIATVRSK